MTSRKYLCQDELLDEPYVQDKALGECDIELPYQVPEGRLFVCGDHRRHICGQQKQFRRMCVGRADRGKDHIQDLAAVRFWIYRLNSDEEKKEAE